MVLISDRLFIDYLQCKYKAYLKIIGKNGIKSDYETYCEKRNEHYRKCAQAYFQQSRKIIPFQSMPCPIDEVRTQKLSAATNISIINEKYDVAIDAVEVSSKSISRYPIYVPILFLPRMTIAKRGKMLLAFQAIALSREQKGEINSGMIIHGDRYSSSKVPLASQVKAVRKIEYELAKMVESKAMPQLRLNDHCKECEFQKGCYDRAKEKDDLSLLKGLHGKEIDALNKKGIFTVTQYSYTFRPRRARRLQAKKIIKHHHALNALAIRTQTIYIADKQEIPSATVKIYLDVEGLPDDNFYYLIGLLVDDGAGVKSHSLWADSKDDEKAIWNSFLSVMGRYDDFAMFYYGHYETKFLRDMSTRYGGDEKIVDAIKARAYNVLAAIYGHIYFPTYSNDLKSIATYLGFRWSCPEASGLMSIVWRKLWEMCKGSQWKQIIITYNQNDCSALQMVQRALNSIDQRPDSSIEQAVKRLEDVRDDKSRGIFKKNEFYYPELSRINDCAYFDYQQSRVYFRTNANIKKRMAISRKPAGITYKANSIINIAPVLYCPYCGQKKPRKYGNYSTWVYDLKMMTGGIKRWVIRCEYKRYSCKVCRRSFMSERSSAAPHKYGRTLVAWTVNQNIARMQTYRVITDEMREIFGYRFRGNLPFLFKQQKAQEYLPAYVGLMRDLVNGSYLHVDETDANIMGCRGYIWVFANAITAVYTFQPTREGAFLKECLGAFKGVLISDFYAAYDSLECPQQKCLIHLIRDINDSLFKYPFDAELQEIGKGFTQILAPIIDTIDKYGLNCKHLHKHKEPVDRFLKKVEKSAYTSEQSANLARRIEKYREKLFTFLDYDGVAWNNNNAEHAIKRFVQLRKVIGGSSTEKGIQEYLVLLSICETLRLRNMSFLRFLISGAKSIEEYELQQKKVA